MDITQRSRSTSPKRNEREEEEEGETPPSPEREIISLYLSSPPFCPSDTPTLSPSLPGALSPNLSSTPLSLPESASFRSEKKKEIYFHPPIIGNVNLAFDYAHYDSLDFSKPETNENVCEKIHKDMLRKLGSPLIFRREIEEIEEKKVEKEEGEKHKDKEDKEDKEKEEKEKEEKEKEEKEKKEKEKEEESKEENKEENKEESKEESKEEEEEEEKEEDKEEEEGERGGNFFQQIRGGIETVRKFRRQDGLSKPRFPHQEMRSRIIQLFETRPSDFSAQLEKLFGDLSLIKDYRCEKSTLLHLFALSSKPDTACAHIWEILIKNGIDLNVQDGNGYTAMMIAARTGKYSFVRYLIGCGADIEIEDHSKMELIHHLCCLCHQEAHLNIFSLVKTVCGHKGKELRKSRRDGKRDRRDTGGKEYVEYKRVYQQDGKGNTPAHLAARYGMLSLVEFFLSECDFYPFFRNFLGHTILHMAAAANQFAVCQYLLSRFLMKENRNGVDSFPLSLRGNIPVDLVPRDTEKGIKLVKLFSQKEKDERIFPEVVTTQMVAAVRSSDISGLEQLIPKSATKAANEGFLLAAECGQLKVCRWFLEERQINPNFSNRYGNTPLMYLARCSSAEKTGYIELLELLRSCGANPYHKNIWKETALQWSIVAQNSLAFSFLVQSKHSVNIINWLQFSELHLAVLTNNTQMLDTLLNLGCDVNIENSRSQTIKEFANNLEQKNCVRVLNSFLSDLNGRDSQRGGLKQKNCCRMNIEIENVEMKNHLIASAFSSKHHHVFAVVEHSIGRTKQVIVSNPSKLSEEYTTSLSLYGRLKLKEGEKIYRAVTVKFYLYNPLYLSSPDQPSSPGPACPIDSGGTQNILSPSHNSQIRRSSPFHHISPPPSPSLLPKKSDSLSPPPKNDLHNHYSFARASFLLEYSSSSKKQNFTVPIRSPVGDLGEMEVEVVYENMGKKELDSFAQSYTPPGSLLRNSNVSSSDLGSLYTPKYPVLLIPGMVSSALEVWKGRESWRTERIWLDPFKIGKPAAFQRAMEKKEDSNPRGLIDLTKSSTQMFMSMNMSAEIRKSELEQPRALAELERGEGSSEAVVGEEGEDGDVRRWVKYLTLQNGVEDPKGIQVRAVRGLHGCDYLCDGIGKKASYVFGPVIKALVEMGYAPDQMDAATYDWRLPFCLLEKRDGYFTSVRFQIEQMHQRNKEKVVVITHSMGARIFQYFLHWIHEADPTWCDTHIHAFLPIGPPFLGAPKALRTTLFGDSFGLDLLITHSESRHIAQQCAGLPGLYPTSQSPYPSDMTTFVSKDGQYAQVNWKHILAHYAPNCSQFHKSYYKTDPLFKKLRDPPPIRRLWSVYGFNLQTEMCYFLKQKKGDLSLDRVADRVHSGKRDSKTNPTGFMIDGGIGYETSDTFQTISRSYCSGDGTVPYCSLSYGRKWEEDCKREGRPFEYLEFEVEGAEHREILESSELCTILGELLCERKWES